MTDEAGQYTHLNKHFASHDYVNHGADEYGRGTIHTNTVDGFYSIFKRGMTGRLSALLREAPAPLRGRVRLPV